MIAPRISLVAFSSLLSLALGCGGAAVQPTDETPRPTPTEEATPPKPPEETPETPAAKPPEETPTAQADTPAQPPPETPPPAPAQGPEPSCEAKAAPGAAKPPKLELSVDRSKVDLEKRSLEVKLSRPACKVKLKVFGDSGGLLAETFQPFDGAAPGTPLAVTWSPSSSEPVSRIEVWGHDTLGYYVGVAIVPWNVKIPHEEVNFETDSDAIRATEVPKLEASLQKIKEALSKHKELGNISLFIAGHTDSVGSAEHNLGLSRRRARSIANWFRGRGVRNPISFEGFGEHSLLVKTPDETAEGKNRRVDYILSVEPPRLPTGSVAFGWKGI